MNLLEPEVLLEVTVIWAPGAPPRMWVSKGEFTREEITRVVADLIGLAVEWGAQQGVNVRGTISKSQQGEADGEKRESGA